jgi:hypothetical protein
MQPISIGASSVHRDSVKSEDRLVLRHVTAVMRSLSTAAAVHVNSAFLLMVLCIVAYMKLSVAHFVSSTHCVPAIYIYVVLLKLA